MSGGLPQTGQQLGDEEGGPLGPHLHTIEEENLEAAGQLNGGAGQWNGGPRPGAGQWDGGQGAGAGRGAGTWTVRLRRIHAAHQSIDIMGVGSIGRDAMMMEEMTIVVDDSGAFGSSGQSLSQSKLQPFSQTTSMIHPLTKPNSNNFLIFQVV